MAEEKKELTDEVDELEAIVKDQDMINNIVDDVFETYDADKNKIIDMDELKVFMTNVYAQAKMPMPTDATVKKAFDDADANKNGVLEKEEMPKLVKDMLTLALENAKARLKELTK